MAIFPLWKYKEMYERYGNVRKFDGKVWKDGRLCDLKSIGNIWKSNAFVQ